MKTIYKMSRLGILASLVLLSSCGAEEPVGTTMITNYAVITYEGGNPMFVNLGDPFTETAVATIDGQEIPFEANYEGRYRGGGGATLDTSVADVYTAEYSAINNEGFEGTET